MKEIKMKRRRFMQGAASVLFLAGVPGRRVDGAELVYDRTIQLQFSGTPEPSDRVRMMAGYVESFSPPTGAMAATGGWKAVYDMVQFFSTPSYQKATSVPMYNTVIGQVAITKPAAAPYYEINMEFESTATAALESVSARIYVDESPIAALKSWEMEWSGKGWGVSAPHKYTVNEQAVVAANHFSITSRGNTEQFELTQPLACFWTLVDAVRRLPATTGWHHEFDMYQDLSSLRRNQSLSFAGCGEVAFATGLRQMNFYEQLGEGIEPIHYAVDKRQRTLFVTQGQLGWGLNRIERG